MVLQQPFLKLCLVMFQNEPTSSQSLKVWKQYLRRYTALPISFCSWDIFFKLSLLFMKTQFCESILIFLVFVILWRYWSRRRHLIFSFLLFTQTLNNLLRVRLNPLSFNSNAHWKRPAARYFVHKHLMAWGVDFVATADADDTLNGNHFSRKMSFHFYWTLPRWRQHRLYSEEEQSTSQ